MGNENTQSKKSYFSGYVLPGIIFIILTSWLLYIHSFDLESTERVRQIWGAVYQVAALYGGLYGLYVAQKWGGLKSLIGRAITCLAISLLFQVFGQSVNSYYNIFLNVQTPYPSLGDVGFFGSAIFYILGVSILAKASGFRFTVKSFHGKLIAFALPAAMLIFSYMFFLKGYEFDWTDKIRIFLDFGYPFADAIYVSIAIFTFILSKNYLGGLMRKPIFILLLALVFQYLVDFMFLYQAAQGTWYVGGINDYLYFASYTVMTLALTYIGIVYHKILDS